MKIKDLVKTIIYRTKPYKGVDYHDIHHEHILNCHVIQVLTSNVTAEHVKRSNEESIAEILHTLYSEPKHEVRRMMQAIDDKIAGRNAGDPEVLDWLSMHKAMRDLLDKMEGKDND